MKKSYRFFLTVAFVVVAAFALADAVVAAPKKTSSKSKTKAQKTAEENGFKKMRWNAPDAEQRWEKIIQTSERLSLEPRMQGVDETQAEGQLEAFGTRYMPNAYAHYQDVRAQALEVEQVVKESFPDGKASDPTGGTMFEKANKKLAESVARSFRRHDELCFFLLFHQAGIFSEDVLAKYDSRPISIQLEPESDDWPDDTPQADTALSAEVATFAAKYLPETHAGYQRLCGLFDEGAKQYADLRRTACTLDAPRARRELLMLKIRLEEMQEVLQGHKSDLLRQRLAHALGETTAESLGVLDQKKAVEIQKYEQEMGLKAYVVRFVSCLFVNLPGGAAMEMVWCPPGTFMMGDGEDNEKPPHQVTLRKGFWMGKTEVTQAQWESVMGNNPSHHKGYDLPVDSVFGKDCKEFCEKTGLQLPTKEQWEYACRAGSTGPYAGTGKLDEMGWYRDNSDRKTHPVATKRPNAWGLYDMHGNVREWCVGIPSWSYDPILVIRGGSYADRAKDCTSFYGGGAGNDYYFSNGFRLVKPLSE